MSEEIKLTATSSRESKFPLMPSMLVRRPTNIIYISVLRPFHIALLDLFISLTHFFMKMLLGKAIISNDLFNFLLRDYDIVLEFVKFRDHRFFCDAFCVFTWFEIFHE